MGVYGTPETDRNKTDFKKVYDILRIAYIVVTKSWELRIVQLQTAIDWSLVWCNLHNAKFPDGGRST